MAGKSYRDAPSKKSSAKIVRSAVRRKLASADLRYPSRVTARRFDDTRRRLVGASVNFRTRPRKSTPKRRVFPTDDRRTPSPRAKLVRQLLGEALAGPQKPEVKKSMNMLADLANPGYPKSKAKAAKGIYRWSAERSKRANAPKASKTDIAKRLMKAAGGKPAALAEAAVEMVKNVATASAKKVERAAAAQAAPRRGERSRKQPSRVKKMKEVVDGFDKFSSERLKGLEERDKKRKDKETATKSKTKSKPHAAKRSPRAKHGTSPAPEPPGTPPARPQAPVLVPQIAPTPIHHQQARAPPRPSQLILSRDLAPPPQQQSPGTASKIVSFLPA
ncbi:hypothetical protein KFL_014040020 [Klebsormidium nitens]|uniref:Uncharacterized protein n=1 Tax=Klebsormidium nitens TaxID=105231 RepID=A0A1Y1IV61_KLENI|nr:hypothetical protein KFL_014040020 [Klebsormidium nitens]|eukprot:GAQ93271.1 hypothetical protein KFL_014040020 [Klebsormidium nitens]